MNTEQDTFDRLRRIPFEQMRLIVREINRNGDRSKVGKAIKDNGWNTIDYHLKLDMMIQGEINNKTALLGGQLLAHLAVQVASGQSRVMYD